MVSTADSCTRCVFTKLSMYSGLFQVDPISAIVDWKHHSGNRLSLSLCDRKTS
jgi:hypothetical protein